MTFFFPFIFRFAIYPYRTAIVGSIFSRFHIIEPSCNVLLLLLKKNIEFLYFQKKSYTIFTMMWNIFNELLTLSKTEIFFFLFFFLPLCTFLIFAIIWFIFIVCCWCWFFILYFFRFFLVRLFRELPMLNACVCLSSKLKRKNRTKYKIKSTKMIWNALAWCHFKYRSDSIIKWLSVSC